MRAECRAADERLAIFVEALQLECLEVYSNCVDGVDIDEEDDENNAAAELPQVSVFNAYLIVLLFHKYLLIVIVVSLCIETNQLLRRVSSTSDGTSR